MLMGACLSPSGRDDAQNVRPSHVTPVVRNPSLVALERRIERRSSATRAGFRKPDASVTDLFEKDSVLFPKKVNRRLLMAIDPVRESCEEDLQGLKGVGHGQIVGTFGPR